MTEPYTRVDLFKEIPILNDEPDEKLEQIVFDATSCLTLVLKQTSNGRSISITDFPCDNCSLSLYCNETTSLCLQARILLLRQLEPSTAQAARVLVASQIIREINRRKEQQSG